jgi:hypothetical protein
MANEKESERGQIRVSPDIHTEIKVEAARLKTTMTDVVENLWRCRDRHYPESTGDFARHKGEKDINSLLSGIISVEEVAKLAELLENAGPEMKSGLAHSLRSALKYYKVIYVTRGKVDR